jgi:hypothetical protein
MNPVATYRVGGFKLHGGGVVWVDVHRCVDLQHQRSTAVACLSDNGGSIERTKLQAIRKAGRELRARYSPIRNPPLVFAAFALKQKGQS